MTRKKGQIIPPGDYPQMLEKAEGAKFAKTLRSASITQKAVRIIEDSAEPLREALLVYVTELEAAGANHALVSDKAHEIKGFADTAGLPATARIAEGLCRYLEQSQELGLPADTAIIALHVSAIGRASRDSDHGGQAGEAVARELAALSAHKLAAAKAGKHR
jgi:hypothetical protein